MAAGGGTAGAREARSDGQPAIDDVLHVVYLAVALAAQRLVSARPRASEVVARASGLAMIAVAATLTAERVPAA